MAYGFANPDNELTYIAFERALKAKYRSELTMKAYRDTLTQWEEWIDGENIVEFDHWGEPGEVLSAKQAEALAQEACEDWMAYKLETFAVTTAATHFRNLRAFYNWAVAEELIAKSPMRKMIEPQIPDAPPDMPPIEDVKALLATCAVAKGDNPTDQLLKRRDEAIIRLFCEAGAARCSEKAKLLLDDLDMRRSRVILRGKGRKVREIPFGAKTGTALDRYLRLRKRHPNAHVPQLWLSKTGVSLTAGGIRQMFSRRCEEAAIAHIHPHLLRHLSAHLWKLKGGSEEDMMYLFGWSTNAMARRYGKSAQKERAQLAAERMSQADEF